MNSVHRLFCPIHIIPLIRQKSLHFEKNTKFVGNVQCYSYLQVPLHLQATQYVLVRLDLLAEDLKINSY